MRRLVTAAFISFFVLIQATAAIADPSVSTDLWIYNDGDTVTVTGVEFGADEIVDVVSTDPDGVEVDRGEPVTDADGGFVYRSVLRATQSGIYDVVATGRTSGLRATTQFDPPPPFTAELRFTDRRFTATGGVVLTWNQPGSSTDCYYVYRSTAAMAALPAAAGPSNCATTVPSGNMIANNVGITNTTYTDTTALTTSDYYYYVQAVKNGNGGGVTVSSNQVTTKSLTASPTSKTYTAAGGQLFTVTNTGLGAMTFRSVTVTGTNAADFVVSGAPAGGTSIPNSGANSFTFTVTFTPGGSGTRNATVNVNASEPSHVLATTFDTRQIAVTGTAPTTVPQTITFDSIPDKTYGDAAFEINPTASSGLTVSVAATGPCSLSSPTAPSTVTITGVGTCEITASQAGDATYDPAPNVVRSFAIGKATLTVTAGNTAREYGAANPAVTPAYSGFVYGQSLATSGVTGAPVCSSAATASSSPGTYANTCTIGTLASDNYSFAFVAGTLTVGQAVLTVTAADTAREYGDANPAVGNTITGFKNGETLGTSDVTGTPDCSSAATTTTSPGAYANTCSAGSLASSDYSFTYSPGTLTIGKAPLTITAGDTARQYGDANPPITASFAGFKLGQTLGTSDVTGSPACTSAATGTSSPGTYANTCATGTLASANYSFTFAGGTLTIGKAPLTITAGDTGRAYGDANPTVGFSATGFKNGQTLGTSDVTGAPSCASAATTSSSPGTYTNSCTIGDLASANYSFGTFLPGTLTIAQAVLTVTAADTTREYGEANPAVGNTITGFTGGETLGTSDVTGDPDCGSAATATSSPGPHATTCSLGTLASVNYSFTFAPGTLTITKAPLTIIAADTTRAYGTSNPPVGFTATGFKNGQVLGTSDVGGAPSCASDATGGSAPGTYANTCTVGTLTSANYSFAAFTPGTLTITPAVLTVTAADTTREYGDANPAVGNTITGFTNSETLATSDVTGDPDCGSTATATTSAGTHANTCAIGTLASTNYTFTFAAGTLTITKAPLTVTAADTTREYGDANPAVTASFSGFKNGETLATSGVTGAPSCSSAATAASAPGAYANTCGAGTLASTNYAFAFAPGTLTITKATLTVTAGDTTREYGDANPPVTPSFTGFKNGQTLGTSDVTGTPACSSAATTADPVGTYANTCSAGTLASTNYAFTFAPGTLTITKATLTVTAADTTREYGDANPTVTASFTGFKNGETLATSGVTGAPSCSSAASATSAPGAHANTCTAGTLAAGNYAFAFAPGTLTITQALLTVTASDTTRAYGASNPAVAPLYSGFKNGETKATSDVTGDPSCSSAATTADPVGTYVNSCALGTLASANYSFTFATGTLTITKATLTVTADAQSKQYSDAMPALTYAITGFQNGETLATSGVAGTPACSTTATIFSGPGTYPITCTTGTLSSSNYTFVFVAGTLTVTQEDALATYTGPEMIFTGSATASNVNVTLTATIQDIADGFPGDISNAQVRFVNPATNAPLCPATAGSWVNVSLVNPADTTVGTAACTFTATTGSGDSQSYEIGIVVGGYYTRTAGYDGELTVSKPLGTGSLTGGGHIIISGSNGTYAATTGTKNNFGFNVKNNKKGTQLQGHANIIFRRMVAGTMRTYQIKTTATDTLTHNATTGKATFTSKANLTDVTNPLAPVSLGGNLALQVDLLDAGEPGSSDTIGITLMQGSTLLFAATWGAPPAGGAPRSLQKTLNGGNLQVR